MVVNTNPAGRSCLRKARHISCSRATHSHELLYHRSKCRYVPVCCRLLFHSCGQLGPQLGAKVKKWILGLWIPGPGKSDHTQGRPGLLSTKSPSRTSDRLPSWQSGEALPAVGLPEAQQTSSACPHTNGDAYSADHHHADLKAPLKAGAQRLPFLLQP